MKIEGRRFHIAGSADAATPREMLEYAHALISQLADAFLQRGGSFTVGVGKEPRGPEADSAAPSVIFDWTVLERVGEHLKRGGQPHTAGGPLIATVTTSKTEWQIPEDRRSLWELLTTTGGVSFESLDAGWFSGAVRRQRQARLADVLILLSGGEGVEQLAELYVQAGKPVIAFDLDLGGSTSDGSGGAARLHKRALAAPGEFIRLLDPSRGGALLYDLRADKGRRAVPEVVSAVLRLIDALVAPTVFSVRLLNPNVADFDAVEDFFRRVVDPVVTELGYTPFEPGRHPTEYAWMNQEIFERLHYSAAVVADVTGLRNNCFMELGYALGHGLRVIVTALEGTRPPFDSATVPHHFWKLDGGDAVRQQLFREFWAKNIGRPAIVRPRSVV